jgi:hypothetical protein
MSHYFFTHMVVCFFLDLALYQRYYISILRVKSQAPNRAG